MLISLVEIVLTKMESETILMAADVVEEEVTNLHVRYVENMASQL